jgi:glycerol kinase
MISAIALDLGTTAIKAGLLDSGGELGNVIARHAPQIAVSGGRYESDALAYAEVAEQVLDECRTQAGDCRTLGLCSQRSSLLIWERASGQPITPLISWQDNRGATSCEALRKHETSIRDLTGLPLTPYYFAPKLRTVLQEDPGWRARLANGELLAGTLDSFLIWRWSGGRYFVTDASMAARTQLMDIRQRRWSPQLCELFGIPIAILPELKPSTGWGLHLDNGMTLQASAADQSAALVASVSEDSPEALVNLGTGCFVVRYLADADLADEQAIPAGYLHTLVYMDPARRGHFAVEGTLNSIAAALEPYPFGQCSAADLAVDDIFCVAEPSGLGAPYFASRRFAACLPDPLRGDPGVQFSQSVAQLPPHRIAALLLEAVIFRVARILEEFHREFPIERVYLSGGLSGSVCLQQGLALCAPFEFYRLRQSETSLQGAALLAAGMAPASHRNGERITIAGDNQALPQKYRRWKAWLDGLLAG